MLAIVKINDRTITNTIVLQENLIQQSEIGQIVFVAGEKDGRKVANMKKVETGLAYGGKVQVLKGLEPGDQLITTGYQDLVDGQLIAN
jgi:multidrug efflux pump subunit AcrA (membrane-fusion protein)